MITNFVYKSTENSQDNQQQYNQQYNQQDDDRCNKPEADNNQFISSEKKIFSLENL